MPENDVPVEKEANLPPTILTNVVTPAVTQHQDTSDDDGGGWKVVTRRTKPIV